MNYIHYVIQQSIKTWTETSSDDAEKIQYSLSETEDIQEVSETQVESYSPS
jgi:hypothetical protein